MKSKFTKVSIITVVFNGESLIEDTIKSIVNQSYPNIEYIIIDGKSSDKTMEIVKQYENHIDVILSEKDDGIYDAMNKGLKIASGEYVWYMNCGDHIHSKDTLMKIMNNNPNDADVLFGEVLLVDNDRNKLGKRSKITSQKLPKTLTWKSLKFGMVVSHQGFIPKKSVCPNYIPNNLSADIDWVIKCLKNSKKVLNTNTVLADYLIGGISKQNHKRSLLGRFKILQKHYGFFPNILNHLYIILRSSRYIL